MIKFLQDIGSLYTEKQELAAIWLGNPVVTAQGPKVRIAAGCLVKIEYDNLVDLPENEQPTHRVLQCTGTMVNHFQLVCLDLKKCIQVTINI